MPGDPPLPTQPLQPAPRAGRSHHRRWLSGLVGFRGHPESDDGVPRDEASRCDVQLPEELWAKVAITLSPCEFMHLLLCRKDLIFQQDRNRLWHFFCHVKGFARGWVQDLQLSSGKYFEACGSSICPGTGSSSKKLLDSQVNWHFLFRRNSMAKVLPVPHLFTWLRIGNEELCFAILEADAEAIFPDHLAAKRCYSPELVMCALRSALFIGVGDTPPLRIRDLRAGRTGFPIRSSRFFVGESPASAVVEFPCTENSIRWAMPPYCELKEEQSQSYVDLVPSVGPNILGRKWGWLVEISGDGSFNPEPRWLHVASHKPAATVTVRDLCKDVSKLLEPFGTFKVWPASLQDPTKPADVEHGFELLRDLRWTQSERILIQKVTLPVRPGLDRWNADPEEHVAPVPGAPSETCKSKFQHVVFFQRDALRSPVALQYRQGRCCSKDATAAAADFAHLSTRECSRGVEALGNSSSSTASQLSRSATSSKCKMHVLHSRNLLTTSRGVRQFEFHPVRANTLLVGKKDGAVAIIDLEKDRQTHTCFVASHPILGLSWLHTEPQWAVVGASQSGALRLVKHDEGRPDAMEQVELEPFSHLSSLSMNCTDDFFMTSGFCVDVGLYDVTTGRRVNTFCGLHQNFINILRFAHRSPHLFATASFDHTCKVWDLRDPNIHADKPAMCCGTDTLNVMCCFAPDDSRLLVSGVDEALRQFDLRMHGQGTKFPVPTMNSSINYRRSLYMAGGEVVATVATNESFLRLYDAGAPHRCLGQVDFRNMLLNPPSARSIVSAGGRCTPSAGPFSRTMTRMTGSPAASTVHGGRPALAQDSLENGPCVEYLQSLRCHPSDPTLLGTLVAASEPNPESYIAAVRLEEVGTAYSAMYVG